MGAVGSPIVPLLSVSAASVREIKQEGSGALLWMKQHRKGKMQKWREKHLQFCMPFFPFGHISFSVHNSMVGCVTMVQCDRGKRRKKANRDEEHPSMYVRW